MNDGVAADTDDLAVFVDHGDPFVRDLRDVHDRVATVRAAALRALRGGPEGPGAGWLDDLVNQAAYNTAYVHEVREALLGVDAAGGVVSTDADVVDAALTEAGLVGRHPARRNDETFFDQLEIEGEIRALEDDILWAKAEGDVDRVDALEAELEALHFEQVDPELAHTFVITRNFTGMFGDGTSKVEEIGDVVNGERRQEILRWLGEQGLSPEQAMVEYQRILAAARYFNRSQPALDRLDAGNASDGGTDGKVARHDGVVNFMTATEGSTNESEQYFRAEMVQGEVGSGYGFAADPLREPDELEIVWSGGHLLGALSESEQQTAIAAFTQARAEANLDPGTQDMYVVPVDTDNEAFNLDLREGYANQAIRLEILGPRDSSAQATAALFAEQSLFQLSKEEQAAMVSAMDGEVIVGGRYRTEAGLLAAALVIPHDLELPESYGLFSGVGFPQARAEIAASVLAGFNDGVAPGSDFTDAQADFVFTTLEHQPGGSYSATVWDRDAEGNAFERYLGDELGAALGTASYAGDYRAQQFHGQRLSAILMERQGADLLGANDIIDPLTRQQLLETTIFGRQPPVSINHSGVPNTPTIHYWNVEDFTEDGSARIVADVAVDAGRAQIIAQTGSDITPHQELHIRTLVGTNQGQDLAGFSSPRVDYTRRNQFVSFLIENPEWTVEEFSGDRSGFDNRLVNGEFALVWAEASQPSVPLSPAQVAQIRAIGRSSDWIDKAGLGTDTTTETQTLYMRGALGEGWTAATFGETDDITLNATINFWMAKPHIDQFGQDPERTAELQSLAGGDTEAYVLAVLGDALPDQNANGRHPALVGDRLEATINEINEQRADGARVNAVPVFLNTGGLQAKTFLFETTDKDGRKIYIDTAGERFSSVNDWYNNSRLPPGKVVFAGTNPTGRSDDATFVSPMTGNDYDSVALTTESYVDTAWEHAEPWVVNGVAIIGAGLFIVNPLAGGAVLGSVGAYQAGKGAHGLYQLNQHGGEIDWSDPRFRGDVMNLAEGSLSMATGGAGGLAVHASKAGRPIGRFATTGLRAANAVEGVYSVGTVGYQAQQIAISEIPTSQKLKALAQIGFTLTAQGVVPIAVGRGVHHMPYTTIDGTYYPGVSLNAYRTARARGISGEQNRLGIVMTDVLLRGEGTGPAYAVAGHSVGDVAFVSSGAFRLVGKGGNPTGRIPMDGLRTSDLSLKDLVEQRPSPVNQGKAIVEQDFAVIETENLDRYLSQLENLYSASGTPLTPEVRGSIREYIVSHKDSEFDRFGNEIRSSYRVPIHSFAPNGENVVAGSFYPGTHADVFAANQALAHAQSIDPQATLADVTLLVHNRKGAEGKHMLSCPNCSGILRDATILSGPSTADNVGKGTNG